VDALSLQNFCLLALLRLLFLASLRRLPLVLHKTLILFFGGVPSELFVDFRLVEVKIVTNARHVVFVESASQLSLHVVQLRLVDAQLFFVCLQLDHFLVHLIFDFCLLPSWFGSSVRVGSTAATTVASAATTRSISSVTSTAVRTVVVGAPTWALRVDGVSCCLRALNLPFIVVACSVGLLESLFERQRVVLRILTEVVVSLSVSSSARAIRVVGSVPLVVATCAAPRAVLATLLVVFATRSPFSGSCPAKCLTF